MVNGQSTNMNDGHATLRPPLGDFPFLSCVCLPEADVRRAGSGIIGLFAFFDEESDHAPDESGVLGW